jgi:hypothetical protein
MKDEGLLPRKCVADTCNDRIPVSLNVELSQLCTLDDDDVSHHPENKCLSYEEYDSFSGKYIPRYISSV